LENHCTLVTVPSESDASAVNVNEPGAVAVVAGLTGRILTEGGVLLGFGLTVTGIAAEVVVAPALSVARAVIE
jgi:hypothetical protein